MQRRSLRAMQRLGMRSAPVTRFLSASCPTLRTSSVAPCSFAGASSAHASAARHVSTASASAAIDSHHVAGKQDSDTGAPPPAPPPLRCLLCDATFESWPVHSRQPAHMARTAVCKAFVVPDRSDSIMKQLEKHIQLDFEAVDEVTLQKEQRRHRRLTSTLLHLADEGVLYHSLPFTGASPKRSTEAGASSSERSDEISSTHGGMASTSVQVSEDHFLNFAFNGEGYARLEVLDRVARLMPNTGAAELQAIVSYLLSERNLARLYDELRFGEVLAHSQNLSATEEVPREEQRLEPTAEETGKESSDATRVMPPEPARLRRPEDKALVIFSCLGELAHLQRQDRSHSVADRAAADVLVRYVLASHAAENLVAELVHSVLQRIVNDGTPVWREHQEEVRQRAAQPSAEGSPAIPAPDAAATTQAGTSAFLSRVLAVSPAPTSPPAPRRGAVPAHDTPAHLQASVKAFLPVERVGTGSTAPGSKKHRKGIAFAASPAPGSPCLSSCSAVAADADGSGEASSQHHARTHWAPLVERLPMAVAPPGAAAAHPGATYAPVTPRMLARKPIQ